jgi:hypothetical protein
MILPTEKHHMTPQAELKVLRQRAKNPFWIQHEWMTLRGDRTFKSSPEMPTEKQARKAFREACTKPRTVHVFLFQHCLSKTLILEQFVGPNEMAVPSSM